MNLPLADGFSRADALSTSFAANYTGVVAFIAVATEGSFARAADRLGVGRSAVSRSVQRLEDHVGARLFSRTTRSTSLTSEGELFLENCRPGVYRILQALEDLRDLRHGPPRGQLRMAAPRAFGRSVLAPLLDEFRLRHPAIGVELLLDERPVDLVVDRIDLVFRDGRLDDSQVIAKQLIGIPALVCASPDYVQRHGLPENLEALSSHACINHRLANGRLREWTFRIDGQAKSVLPAGDLIFNDDELALQAVLAGRGLAQLPAFQVRDLLKTRRLVSCLRQFAPDDRAHYLCYLSRQQLPKRIRVFIDFITPRIRALDLDCTGKPPERSIPLEPRLEPIEHAAS
jgi:DNA-binding transcriptional LysR family regulator